MQCNLQDVQKSNRNLYATNPESKFEKQHKHIEEKLHKYKILAENASDIMLFINSEGRIIEANNECCG